jgi:mRNA interferase YafQ
MMELKMTSQFKRDLKRYKHNVELLDALETVLKYLAENGTVPSEYLPHPLIGDYKSCLECHVLNDLLLIWVDKFKPQIKLLRLGSHSELYGKGKKR